MFKPDFEDLISSKQVSLCIENPFPSKMSANPQRRLGGAGANRENLMLMERSGTETDRRRRMSRFHFVIYFIFHLFKSFLPAQSLILRLDG